MAKKEVVRSQPGVLARTPMRKGSCSPPRTEVFGVIPRAIRRHESRHDTRSPGSGTCGRDRHTKTLAVPQAGLSSAAPYPGARTRT